jgi:hypothetical protein
MLYDATIVSSREAMHIKVNKVPADGLDLDQERSRNLNLFLGG